MAQLRFRYPHALPLLAMLLGAGPASAEQLPITPFSIAEGLPHSRVLRIYQDSQGFIWFCTGEGLSRFDGYAFENYKAEDGLPYSTLNDILETENGDYWIATNGAGVVLFKPNAPRADADRPAWFTTHAVASDPAANRVNVLYRDRSGRLWVGTDGGLFLHAASGDKRFQPVPLGLAAPDAEVQVWAMAEDAAGVLWIGTRFGLVRRAPDATLHQYRIAPRSSTDHVRDVLFDRDKRLWLAHQTGLILVNPDAPESRAAVTTAKTSTTSLIIAESADRPLNRGHVQVLPLRAGEAQRFTTADGLAGDNVTALEEASSGALWIGSRGDGVTEFSGGRFRAYTREHGISSTIIQTISEDRGGNIWIGSVDGALRLALNGFTIYSEPDGVGPMTGVMFERDGYLYAASYNFRISRFDGERFHTIRPQLPDTIANWRPNHGILLDRSGEWWMATREGLYRFPRVDRFEDLARAAPRAVYTETDGLATNDVTLLHEDQRGDVWIGHFVVGEEVLTRWERSTGRFHRYSSRDGLTRGSSLQTIAESRNGDVWMGFRDGELVRYRAGRFEVVLPGGDSPPRGIGSLHFERSGVLWVAIHAGGGLVRIDARADGPPQMTRYTTAEGLSNDNMSCLTQDGRGRIFVVTGSGIDRFDPATGRVTRYSVLDGVNNTECSMALQDGRGSLWFNTARGILRVVPSADRTLPPPRMVIARLQIAGEDEPMPALGAAAVGPMRIASGRNRVEIEYFALTQDVRRLPRYQYKLEGSPDDWSRPTNQRQITYANLSPGRYRFLVRAIDADGALSSTPASVQFTILAPVWQRWWFLSAALLLIAAGAYSFHRQRMRRAIELERVRMRIATDLHDEVGSGLSQVSVLSEVVNRRVGADPTVAEPLSTMATVSRDLVDSMNDIVWAINPSRDHLADLTQRMRRFASDVLGAVDVELGFDVPDASQDMALGADVRRELWLIFKESVNNAVRHSRCSRVDVTLRIEQGTLLLRIADNGVGVGDRREDRSGGHGLDSMRRRADRIGGSIEIASEPGHGTVITCRAPVRRRGWRALWG